MKHCNLLLRCGLLASVLAAASLSAAPLGTLFTYQGRLDFSGQPANGSYQMTFWLYANFAGGTPIASNIVPVVPVNDGLFTRTVDFGPNRFTGDEGWLAITVATNGSSAFTLLQPRTRIAPTPNALYAGNAGTANFANIANSVATGAVHVGCHFTQEFSVTATDECGNTSLACVVTYEWTVATAPVIAGCPTGGALGCNPLVPQ